MATPTAHKKSMKFKLGVRFEIAKIYIDPCQEDDTEKAKADVQHIETITWSTNPKSCTNPNMNTIIDN